MKVLVACEFSGIVRDAFIARGHQAISCDLLPTEVDGPHIQGDVAQLLAQEWDLIIAHPPCTRLCSSGARWKYEKPNWVKEQEAAVRFFLMFDDAVAPRICIENPVGIMSTRYRKPDQIIQPWQFGHGETKKTCFWLKGLPLLLPTNIVEGRVNRIHRMAPSADRGKERSRFYVGIADAMAEQWGVL